MTNGEKIQSLFPNKCPHVGFNEKYGQVWIMENGKDVANFTLDWWNAEYKESTTKKDCNTCTHSNEIDGSNCYECVKDMCNNYDPTTKKDLGVEEVTALAEWTTAYSQGYADGVKSVNICPYCGEYIGEEE